jgi:ParB family chromosome partitioning protein
VSKGNKGFGALLTDGLDEASSENETLATESVLASRSQTLARLATGKVVSDRTEFVDPARCRPWRLHNRDLSHLNEESCRDLIDAFLSAKKQRIPAIVRKVHDDPECDFEIIAGVRRWWTVKWLQANNHPEFDYLVTSQRLADEEAFRVSDIENRSRKDISDWERAKDYTRALAEFYENSQSKMAEHINISKSWLSRLIDVARLPEDIVRAFSDVHDITVRVARDIKPLLGDARTLSLMAAEAANIVDERLDETGILTGPEVAKRLVRATTSPKRNPKDKYEAVCRANGDPLLLFAKAPRGGALTIKVVPKSGASRDELVRAFGEILDRK